ncbi:AzlC family ABC transporter permease [Listeria aquatica]|uniref:AzlC family ABC transporter permease n=1 Tax=Listeria aquatica TaxID=1494960 RepID=UPI003F6FA12F
MKKENEIMDQQQNFLAGVKACLPTVLGYAGIGIAAGVVGKASQLSILEVTLLAALVYAGAAQFIICGMLVLHTPISAIVLTAFLINSRHFLMSMATAPSFKKDSLLHNLGIGALLTDESFAVAMNKISRSDQISASWMHGLNLTAYLTWILACFVGAVLGAFLPNPESFGLDFALTAMFIGLLYLQLISDKSKKIRHALLVMASVALLVVLFMRYLSPELAVLLVTLIGCLIGVVTEK